MVPLGAGDACLGAIAFYRAEGGPRWTEAECEAAQEIGHDLGRLLSVRRALRLEHEAVEELRALDGYKSQLIATVAHELKNPIAAIRGNLELAAAELEDDVEGAEAALEAVGRGADRIGRIVDSLLLLAAANDPHQAPRREPVELGLYVLSGVQLAVDSSRREVSEVTTDLPDEPLVLTADPDGIEQVVVNLVGNALKYTPRGRKVSVCLRRRGDEAVLTVTDEGIGISPEDQERIFAEFFRSTDPAARRQPGTGLGLAIVDRIVDHHGGRIEVDSAVGRGSTFRVVLPIR
jgi:signal transduction histidine kinase